MGRWWCCPSCNPCWVPGSLWFIQTELRSVLLNVSRMCSPVCSDFDNFARRHACGLWGLAPWNKDCGKGGRRYRRLLMLLMMIRIYMQSGELIKEARVNFVWGTFFSRMNLACIFSLVELFLKLERGRFFPYELSSYFLFLNFLRITTLQQGSRALQMWIGRQSLEWTSKSSLFSKYHYWTSSYQEKKL